jgi:hypothetical protein
MTIAMKKEQPDNLIPKTDLLTFLGTSGARLMVAHQILASGGLWLDLGGTQILLDPGPGCLIINTIILPALRPLLLPQVSKS